MSIFKEVKLQWNGRDYVIPPDNVLMAIAKVEDILTLGELSRAMVKNTIPTGKLAQAFGAILRHAGANVTDDEVYAGMFGSGDRARAASSAVSTLLVLMIPPAELQQKGDVAPKRPGKKRSGGR